MNCYQHSDQPAVATCANCGVGLCTDCVNKSYYAIDNKPLCHSCNLTIAESELRRLKKEKTWTTVKLCFVVVFMVLGIIIFLTSGDLMNGWIYFGLGGIPSAFRSTRQTREQRYAEAVHDRVSPGDSLFASLIFFIVRLFIILAIAPIASLYLSISNAIRLKKNKKQLQETEEAYQMLQQL